MLVGEHEPMDRGDDLFGDAEQGDGVGKSEDIPDDEAEAEMAPKRISPDPGQPTEQEVSEHCVDHWPYRCWCEHCVKGRGTGEKHRESAGSSIPIIAFDYLFVTERGIQRREELEGRMTRGLF